MMSLFLICLLLPVAFSQHHFKRFHARHDPLIQHKKRQNNGGTPLVVTNHCDDDIYPGISTQSGNGPSTTGMRLQSGDTYNLTVSENWQGRVWGRTNCSFNSQGTANGGQSACGTGDCNGALECRVGGNTPVTLAEFTLDANGQTFYDISLVDGYNLPMAIVLLPNNNSTFTSIPANITNPSCVATYGQLASKSFNPYGNGGTFLGTSSSSPLPFDTNVTDNFVDTWCPWDLQVNKPSSPSDGVYNYPDTSISRPAFNPCYSACAKYNDDQDCCTGNYNSPQSCHPGDYSMAAKSVCPDAYSYAYDDQDSTFVIPSGAGFEVVFCPGGRSTTILTAESAQLSSLANTGHLRKRDQYGSDYTPVQREWSQRRQAAMPTTASGVWQVLIALVVGFVLAGALVWVMGL